MAEIESAEVTVVLSQVHLDLARAVKMFNSTISGTGRLGSRWIPAAWDQRRRRTGEPVRELPIVQLDFFQERFEHYLTKSFNKTASLMAHSCQANGKTIFKSFIIGLLSVAALLAGVEQQLVRDAFLYGRNIGIKYLPQYEHNEQSLNRSGVSIGGWLAGLHSFCWSARWAEASHPRTATIFWPIRYDLHLLDNFFQRRKCFQS